MRPKQIGVFYIQFFFLCEDLGPTFGESKGTRLDQLLPVPFGVPRASCRVDLLSMHYRFLASIVLYTYLPVYRE